MVAVQAKTATARYKRKLRRLPQALAVNAARAAATNAKEMQAAAQRDVEVDTGGLKASVKAFPVSGTFGTVWRVVAGERDGNGFQARFREFGTQHQEANPFFFVNYRALRPRFRRRSSRASTLAAKEVARVG